MADGGGVRPLPRGPHKLPREIVTDHQRWRLLTAAAQVLAEHGYAELTVEHIIREAGVSRTTFYEHFKNKRGCILAAHGVAFERLSSTIVRACGSEGEGPRKLAAGVSAAVDYAAAAPEEAQLLALDVIGADPVIAKRALASSDLLVDLLRGSREHSPYAEMLPELTERALVGAIVSVIADRLISGQADRLSELKPQLVQLALMPYVGIEEARRLATSGA
jgi:AcrR family transcriptional regulator